MAAPVSVLVGQFHFQQEPTRFQQMDSTLTPLEVGLRLAAAVAASPTGIERRLEEMAEKKHGSKAKPSSDA
ncbi:MAG: hypothetical protein Q8R02_04635 [Hyphomonadaceae bacterium]|nr:hypothetical protein [Hyphomonadaceae bacterium]